MNSLSWMLYLSGVVSGLKIVACALLSVGMCGAFILALCFPDLIFEARSFKLRSACRGKLWIAAALTIFLVIAPSEGTIYMIAASEAGETIIKTPEAREVFNDLKAIIKSKLKEQLPKPQ